MVARVVDEPTPPRPKNAFALMSDRIAEIAPLLKGVRGPEDVTLEHVSNLAWALGLKISIDLPPAGFHPGESIPKPPGHK